MDYGQGIARPRACTGLRVTVKKNGAAQTGTTTTTTTTTTYKWWDSLLQNTTNYVSGSANNTSTFYYDKSGHLQSVQIADGRPRTVSFITDTNSGDTIPISSGFTLHLTHTFGITRYFSLVRRAL